MQNNPPKILVTDDDTRLRNLLQKYLSDNGFDVQSAKDGVEARELISKHNFDLIIMDVMMPNENGIELTKSIRQNHKIPVIMLTARGDFEDRITGLEAGAEDYMQKPFEPKELLLRMNNILKRNQAKLPVATNVKKEEICKFGDFIFDFSDLRLKKAGEHFYITESETKIINFLCQNLGKIVSREKLSEICGNIDYRSVDVQVTRLRRKIEDNPKKPIFLQTVRNKGYILHC